MENDQRRALMERIRPALERARRVPTGEKPTGICTRCGLPSSFEVATVGSTGKKLGTATTVENGDERVLLCRCRNCGRHMVVFERYVRSPRVHPHWTVFGAFPAAVPVGISDVPENIAELCREAATCLSVGCYRATGFLSRCIIESAADHQGATGRSLHEKITSLEERLPQELIDAWVAIKDAGNDAAHKLEKPWGKEEAESLFQFAVETLRELYERPARLEEVRRMTRRRRQE